MNALKEEVEAEIGQPMELTDEILNYVVGGLDHTLFYLSTVSENVQSEESAYRDADMKKEMAEVTKNNILMQPAQSMTGLANQKSQGVLPLLQ